MDANLTDGRTGVYVRAGMILIAFVILLALLWTVRSFVLLLFFTVLLALPLSAGARFLKDRFRVPRALGVALLVLVTIGILVGSGILLTQRVSAQMRDVREQLPRAVDKLEAWIERRPFVDDVVLGGSEVVLPAAAGGQRTEGPTDAAGDRGDAKASSEERQASRAGSASGQENDEPLSERLAGQVRDNAGKLFPFVMSSVSAIGAVLLAIFLIIYFAVDPRLYRHGVLRLVPERHRKRTAEVGGEVGNTLTRWLGAQAISMAVIGAITTVALLLLDVKAALALGILAGISEFVPVFGPILTAVPALAIAFLDSPSKALYVLIAYVAIQQLESNVVTPLVMKHGVDVPPVVTILSGTIMTILFGFVGLLIAVPLAAAILTVSRELTTPVEEPV